MLTLDELLERLAGSLDHEEVCELLDISVEDLLDRFSERVADKYDRIMEEFEDD